MNARVIRPGLQTSVQDLGRYGLQHLGIVPCGAMDTTAHRMANALVGNPPHAATLECTVVGPVLEFEEDALISICGALFDARCGNERVPAHRPVLIAGGSRLALGAAQRGARGYLAIAGGIGVPEVLSSRSTYAPAGFGGHEGRTLQVGDIVPLVADVKAVSNERFRRLAATANHEGVRSVRWSVPPLTLPPAGALQVRAIEGRHFDQFDAQSRQQFFSSPWRVSPESNRMGYRLVGPRLQRVRPIELLSEPTSLGTVQAPNDGAPIALMADHQTTGGYPKIAEIASAEIAGFAQLAPGAELRFSRCSVDEAVMVRRQREALLAKVLKGVEWAFQG